MSEAKLSDLKLIDELLIDIMWSKGMRPADLEMGKVSSVVNDAMKRLRSAWKSGEMKLITLSFARYFEQEPAVPQADIVAAILEAP